MWCRKELQNLNKYNGKTKRDLFGIMKLDILMSLLIKQYPCLCSIVVSERTSKDARILWLSNPEMQMISF